MRQQNQMGWISPDVARLVHRTEVCMEQQLRRSDTIPKFSKISIFPHCQLCSGVHITAAYQAFFIAEKVNKKSYAYY